MAGELTNPRLRPETALGVVRDLLQTAYFHFRTPPEAVAQLDAVISQGRSIDLTELGIALHLVQDVGTPRARGPHTGGAFMRVPVQMIPGIHPLIPFQYGAPLPIWHIGHPLRAVYDEPEVPWWVPVGPFGTMPTLPRVMLPSISHDQDIPAYTPEEATSLLRYIYGFLVRARSARYGSGAPDAPREPVGSATVPAIVESEIASAVSNRTQSAALAYMARRDLWVVASQARDLRDGHGYTWLRWNDHAAQISIRSYTRWVILNYQTNGGVVGTPGWKWIHQDVGGYVHD